MSKKIAKPATKRTLKTRGGNIAQQIAPKSRSEIARNAANKFWARVRAEAKAKARKTKKAA